MSNEAFQLITARQPRVGMPTEGQWVAFPLQSLWLYGASFHTVGRSVVLCLCTKLMASQLIIIIIIIIIVNAVCLKQTL